MPTQLLKMWNGKQNNSLHCEMEWKVQKHSFKEQTESLFHILPSAIRIIQAKNNFLHNE